MRRILGVRMNIDIWDVCNSVLRMSGCEKAKNEEMFKAQQWFGRLGSVARFRANWHECHKKYGCA